MAPMGGKCRTHNRSRGDPLIRRITAAALAAAALAAPVAAAAAPAEAAAAPTKRYCGQAVLSVWASPQTSCKFAKAVARKVLAAPIVRYRRDMYGPKPGTYRVYSTVAHRWVRMYCRMILTPDSPYEFCTGGNGARVWIYS